jgi:hypothetical protein
MHSIWKYVVNLGATTVSMPIGAKVLTVAMQYESLCVWALVDPLADREVRRFMVFGTGHPIEVPDTRLIYVGTIQLQGGAFIGHVFEVIE